MLSSVDNIIILNVILCNFEVGLPLVCVTHMHCQLHVLRTYIVSCICYAHAFSVALHCIALQVCRGITGKYV